MIPLTGCITFVAWNDDAAKITLKSPACRTVDLFCCACQRNLHQITQHVAAGPPKTMQIDKCNLFHGVTALIGSIFSLFKFPFTMEPASLLVILNSKE